MGFQTEDIAVQCKKVKKYYGDLCAVDSVDLILHKGEILCLLGPSGCGKTTMLRMIAGLERLNGGIIRVGDKVLSSAQYHIPPERRNIGIVFQDYALFPHMTVKQNVSYGLRKINDIESRVEEVLDLVGLNGLEARMPHQLSGGQQQRVALARALAPHPEVILFDEPFSNLDAGLRRRLRTDIRRILKEAEISAIFVTHDQEEALSIADRVAVMWEGKVLQNDIPNEIYCSPVTRQVATIIGEVNLLTAEIKQKKIFCELGVFNLEQFGCTETGLPLEWEGRAEVMIRPENLEIRYGKQGKAKVVSSEYLGHTQLVWLQLESGTFISCRSSYEQIFQPGFPVEVQVKGRPMVYLESK